MGRGGSRRGLYSISMMDKNLVPYKYVEREGARERVDGGGGDGGGDGESNAGGGAMEREGRGEREKAARRNSERETAAVGAACGGSERASERERASESSLVY